MDKNLSHQQGIQDKIWDYYQIQDEAPFYLSYPRLLFLAAHCRKGDRILNIGVGSGYLEALLAKRKVEIFCLDPSAAVIQKIRETLGLGERAKVGHGHQIPFEADFFDGVIMTEVLEHLADDSLDPTIRNVYWVLRPGGIFLGTVPHGENLSASRVFCPFCNKVFHRWGHSQSFNREFLKKLLLKNGFQIRQLQTRAFPDWKRLHPKLVLKAVMRYILGRMGEPIVNPSIFFKAQKPSF